jgi:DNA-binding CsgD family transcriptional regulator
VISNLPGVRTDRICENIVPLAKRLHRIWMAGDAQAVVLDKRVAELHACAKHDCALPCAFPGMVLTLVHGTRNKRDGYDSLYIALRRQPYAINGAEARLRLLADSIIHQVDVAYRNVTALRTTKAPSIERTPSGLLSVREEEIASWLCQGKTNVQVAQLLGISVNTVKNHVQRIFDKVGASNRTEAVAKYLSA